MHIEVLFRSLVVIVVADIGIYCVVCKEPKGHSNSRTFGYRKRQESIL